MLLAVCFLLLLQDHLELITNTVIILLMNFFSPNHCCQFNANLETHQPVLNSAKCVWHLEKKGPDRKVK